jgi:ABC-2 type transport system permease protein
MSWQRISALVMRHNYLYRRNLARLLDILFWPVVELVVWGFVTVYLMQSGDTPRFVEFFLGALIFWEVIYRSSLGVSVGFLEDLWHRNFLNLFASPLRLSEFISALILSSGIRIMIGLFVMVVTAGALYSFNLFTLGFPLIAFFLNLLVFGWILGIVSMAIILRFGQGAEIIAWAFVFLFQPLSAVFYPVAVLPQFLQVMAHGVPASHVFEGMRALISGNGFSWSEFFWAAGLNALYLAAALSLFAWVFSQAKIKGRLTKMWQ